MQIGIVGDRLAARTGYAARSVLKVLPGARWSAVEKCWTYPLNYPSILALGTAAKRLRENIEPTPEASAWAAKEAQTWTNLRTEAETLRGDEEAEGFFPHQVQAAHWLAMYGANGGRLDTSVGIGQVLQRLETIAPIRVVHSGDHYEVQGR